MNKVTIIIPLYNLAHLVTEAIESALSQTHKDIEIIVVDDGSTDNPKDVLASYIEQGKISYIFQENRGLSAARNTGIKASQGRYIKFLDSDDFLYPQQIELQVNDIKDENKTFSVTDYQELRPNGELIKRNVSIERKDRQFAFFVQVNRAAVHAFLIPKDLIEKAGPFDESLTACEDWDMWIRILKNGASIKHFPYPGCCYRISALSMSADMKKMYLQECKVLEKTIDQLIKDDDLTPYMKDSLLTVSVRLIEEGIARRVNLNTVLPNTLRLSSRLFQERKTGVMNSLFCLLGVERFTWIRYAVKKLKDHDYEYKILHVTLIDRYGDQFPKDQGYSPIKPFIDTIQTLEKRGFILMYHRVSTIGFDPWKINVTPQHFDEQMQILKKYGQPVKFEEFIKKLKQFNFGKFNIAVTFDDGYADNYKNARPVLERHRIPATFFIVSGAVGNTQEFWWDELERIVFTPTIIPSLFCMTIKEKEYIWNINLNSENKASNYVPPNKISISRLQLFYALWNILSDLTYAEKWHYLPMIADWTKQLTQPRNDNFPMSVNELIRLSRSPLFELGSHTKSHPMLSKLSRIDQFEEINSSKKALETMLGKSVNSFAYPHGENTDTTVELLKECGYSGSCCVDKGIAYRNSNTYRLPRFMVWDWNGREFEDKLLSWLK